jgi:type I restriction enzyme R subunit
MGQPEYDKTEEPMTGQLAAMGWTHLQGGPPGEPARPCATPGAGAGDDPAYPAPRR